MSWLPIVLLAAIAFVIAAFVLRMPKGSWALLGAALMLGLAGYALQGLPGYAGAPKEARIGEDRNGTAMVEARRELFDPDVAPARFVTVSDGFARRGQFGDAAGILRSALRDDPEDGEAWLALGNALVEHANGMLTPAALFAYTKAEQYLPGHPGPAYFLGVSLIRSGRFMEARGLWIDALASAPEDAPWRESLEQRIARLDEMIAQATAQ